MRPDAERTSTVAGSGEPAERAQEVTRRDQRRGTSAGKIRSVRRVAERLRQRVAPAVGARLGQAAAARWRARRARRPGARPSARREREARRPSRATPVPPARDGAASTPADRAPPEQRIEHGARAVGDGEELARLLALERHAELARRTRPSRAHVEAAQHLADGGRRGAANAVSSTAWWVTLHRPPPETRILAPSVRAPSRTHHAAAARMPPGPDRGHEAGGAGAHHGEIRVALGRPLQFKVEGGQDGRVVGRLACPCARRDRWTPRCSGRPGTGWRG